VESVQVSTSSNSASQNGSNFMLDEVAPSLRQSTLQSFNANRSASATSNNERGARDAGCNEGGRSERVEIVGKGGGATEEVEADCSGWLAEMGGGSIGGVGTTIVGVLVMDESRREVRLLLPTEVKLKSVTLALLPLLFRLRAFAPLLSSG